MEWLRRWLIQTAANYKEGMPPTIPIVGRSFLSRVDELRANADHNKSVTGFSHMHDSGTGGVSFTGHFERVRGIMTDLIQSPSLGNFPLFPQSGCLNGTLDNCYFAKTLRASSRIKSTVIAEPGYFALSLNTSINTEMTVTKHTALYRFTFPSTPVAMKTTDVGTVPYEPLILLDLTDLSDSRSNASISVDDSGRIKATGTFNPSFGVGTYTLHACAEFSGARIKQTGVFQNNRAGTSPKELNTYADGVDSPPVPAGAFVQFEKPYRDNQILVRVGLSFVSIDQACSNAEKEAVKVDFASTRQIAHNSWAAKLGVVDVDATGVNKSIQTIFWSGMYRAMISPQDYTGENPLWESSEPCE